MKRGQVSISADGLVIIGRSVSASGSEAFRWTEKDGMVPLGILPSPDYFMEARGVSDNGSVIVGWMGGPNGIQAYRWTEKDGMVFLPNLGGDNPFSRAHAVNADGSIIVGACSTPEGNRAARWTGGGTSVFSLGSLGTGSSEARAVSADGMTVAGATSSSTGQQAFRWTPLGMVGLGSLPGGTAFSEAHGMSLDGTATVGQSGSSVGIFEPFRWTASGGMQGLGHLAPGPFAASIAMTASADGSVIVGRSTSGTPDGAIAFIWDASRGMRGLKAVLEEEYDLDLSGWVLQLPTGVSGDGTRIVGFGINPQGDTEAWLATLPVDCESTKCAPGSGPDETCFLKPTGSPPQNPTSLNLFVHRLEINQGFQTEVNEVSLIQGRETFVRAFVDWTGGFGGVTQDFVSGVDAILYVCVDGSVTEYRSLNGPRTLQRLGGHLPDLPQQENSSINFLLDAPYADEAVFRVDLNPSMSVPELSYCDNCFAVTKELHCRRSPTVGFVPISNFGTEPDANLIAPGRGDAFVQGIVPTPRVNYVATGAQLLWELDVNKSGHQLLLALSRLYSFLNQRGESLDYLYGWLHGQSYSGHGRALEGGRTAFGNADPDRYTRTFAHELGHNLDVAHGAGTIGKWGVDVRNRLGFGRIRSPLLYDVMVPDQLTQDAWVGQATYEKMMGHFALQCPNPAAASDHGPVFLVTGIFEIKDRTGHMEPILATPFQTVTPTDRNGILLIRGYTHDDELMHVVQFLPDHGGEGASSYSPIAAFAVHVPQNGPEGQPLHRIDLVSVSDGKLVDQRIRSDSPPVIEFLSPPDSSSLIAGSVITWDGFDPDGEELLYTLSYSWDGGLSRLPVVVAAPVTEWTFQPSAVPGSTAKQAMFFLSATDGFNSTEVVLGNLTADHNHPPTVHIVHPAHEEAFLEFTTLFLDAYVYDPEDVTLDDESIMWSSDVEGVIGFGRDITTSELSVGVHTVTVMAKDSDGEFGSDRIQIEITSRPLGPPEGDLNYDGVVDVDDLFILLAAWGKCADPDDCPADLDGNGVVDVDDLFILLANWG